MSTKEEIFKDSLKRCLNILQLYKYCLDDLRNLDTVKEISKQARENKKKSFIDIRAIAAEGIRGVDATLLKLQSISTNPVTWNIIKTHMQSDCIHEISLIIDEISDVYDPDKLEQIREVIVNYKKQQNDKV